LKRVTSKEVLLNIYEEGYADKLNLDYFSTKFKVIHIVNKIGFGFYSLQLINQT